MRSTRERRVDELSALHAYYTALADRTELAMQARAGVPEIPPLEELVVIDGWVVRNGRPIWSVRDRLFTDAQLSWTGLPAASARSAWIQATERCLDITQAMYDRTADHVRLGNRPPEHKARVLAHIGYFSSLLEQQRRAIHGKDLTPVLPDSSELEFVDGWLLWKGRPVWWSGDGAGRVSATASTGSAEACVGSSAPARRRRRLRRLLALPWRRAAA
jgi:hypothetical protein